MAGSISAGKNGTIVYEDDGGIITFEAPARGSGEVLDSSHIADIEGNIDLAAMEDWIAAALVATRIWLSAPR